MNLGRLSINQPVLAIVLSIVLFIVGAIAYQTLPVSEYPQVAPPTVTVTTLYPGASAQTVSDTVAAPIEQEINGVEDMIHAGTYSAALSYLKAVKAAGTKDSDAVAKKLKELPVDDAFAQGKVLANGSMITTACARPCINGARAVRRSLARCKWNGNNNDRAFPIARVPA